MVSEVAGIQKCFLSCEDEENGYWRLKTDGVNIPVCQHIVRLQYYTIYCVHAEVASDYLL